MPPRATSRRMRYSPNCCGMPDSTPRFFSGPIFEPATEPNSSITNMVGNNSRISAASFGYLAVYSVSDGRSPRRTRGPGRSTDPGRSRIRSCSRLHGAAGQAGEDFLEALDGPQVAHAGRLFFDAQHPRGLRRVELLKVPQSQHF